MEEITNSTELGCPAVDGCGPTDMRALPVNSTDQGIAWFEATLFNASASWFVCLSCNVLLLVYSSREEPGLKSGFSGAVPGGRRRKIRRGKGIVKVCVASAYANTKP